MQLTLGLGLGACAPNLAGQAKPPELDRPGEAKCGVTKSQSEPLIVEWPSTARAKLEALSRTGVVAVRYSGCEMEVLAACNAPGKYVYTAITSKRDRVTIRNADDLYANIPLGAAKLESKLESAGQLDVDMSVVGRYASDRQVVRPDELEGPDCAKATHVVTGLTVGAFEFFAGADATTAGGAAVGNAGAGGSMRSSKELLDSDGKMKTCDAATTSDAKPPEGCGAILRLEVVPLGQVKRAQPIVGPAPAPPPTAEAGAAAPSNAGAPGEIELEVPDRDHSFDVTVIANGQTHTCPQPVTYFKPCRIESLPEGAAKVVVRGTSSFEREVRVSDDGRTKVQLLHRGNGGEIAAGIITLVGGGMVAFGLLNGGGLSSGDGGTRNPSLAINVVAVTLGATFGFVGLIGFLGGTFSAHDGLMVQNPGKTPELAVGPGGVRF